MPLFFCAKRKVEIKMFGHIMYIVFMTNRKDYEAVLLSLGKTKVSLGEIKVPWGKAKVRYSGI